MSTTTFINPKDVGDIVGTTNTEWLAYLLISFWLIFIIIFYYFLIIKSKK